MRFYDRSGEMETLRRAVRQKGSAMVVISGRRRVGKSRLVDEFMKENDGYRAFAVPKEEKMVAGDFADALSEGDGYRPVFNTVRDAFEYFLARAEKRIMYVDEFPNLLEVNPSIPFELQKLWERYSASTDKVLILSGSYVGMMDRIFTRRKAPLFGRAAFRLVLDPLDQRTIWEIQEGELGVTDPAQMIANYCIFGGIPYYYEVMAKQGGSSSAVDLFFDVGPLREEGQDVLRQEFGGTYKKYFSILEAIGHGFASAGEIGNRIGIRQTTLSKYLIALQNDFKLVRREVPFGQNPYRSKKGAYVLADNLLAFWFSLVRGRDRAPRQGDLDSFIGRRFELLCMDFLTSLLAGLKETVIRKGRWWGPVEVQKGGYEQREIDVVIETERALYIGECKWSDTLMDKGDLRHLKRSAAALEARKPVRWVLFSKAGFSGLEEGEDLLLFDARRIIDAKVFPGRP
jgi:AAA+ ATPase superfamily predicted ATPase